MEKIGIRRQGVRIGAVAAALMLGLSANSVASAEESTPEPTAAAATAEVVTTAEATASPQASPAEATSTVPDTGTVITTEPGYVLPNSSDYPVLQRLMNLYWSVAHSVGGFLASLPLSAGLSSQNAETHNVDPRFPNGEQVVVPASVDLTGAIADPSWFKNNAMLQGVGAQYISAYSTAMGRDIPLIWVPAPDQSTPRPVIYALDGIGGGVWGSYLIGTDIVQRAQALNLNVVMPAAGANSNYLDWYDDSAVASGKQQWETFLTKELPVPLEDAIGASHQRSLTGMSMAGGAVVLFAEHNPGLYDAIGAVSGCGESNSSVARFAQQMVLKDLGTTDDLYGPLDGEFGMYNDSLINAPALEGQDNIYVFNAGGLLGPQDLDPNYIPDTLKDWYGRIVNGAAIEWTTGACAHRLEMSLASRGIPATFAYAAAGSHSWGVFNQGVNGFMDMIGERVYPKQ